MDLLRPVSVRDKLDAFSETWSPKIIARVNEFAVKAVKLDGEFIWHHHDDDDEIFFVVRGHIDMFYRDDDGDERVASFGEGDLLTVPRGVEHKPVAAPGTELLLIERAEVANTGNVHDSDRRRDAVPL
ncbi:MAG TPA: cupin domain-containing protein [Candidatus Elarobacter sp.]|jgi:mannose-6-phosphate isomerase-like protein (cupin superfamily)|nr:cupin domain-containing protein [Candidatus Elarobacter sp.]